jgi:hypothetical protein
MNQKSRRGSADDNNKEKKKQAMADDGEKKQVIPVGDDVADGRGRRQQRLCKSHFGRPEADGRSEAAARD